MISHCLLLSSYHTLSKNISNTILSSNTLRSLCYGIYSLFPTVTMKEKTVGTDKAGLGVRVSRVMNSSANFFLYGSSNF